MTTAEQIDNAASGIQDAKKAIAALVSAAQAFTDKLNDLENALRYSAQNYTPLGKVAGKLIDRAEALRRLRNQMEVGSFSIEAQNALDEAWRSLP